MQSCLPLMLLTSSIPLTLQSQLAADTTLATIAEEHRHRAKAIDDEQPEREHQPVIHSGRYSRFRPLRRNTDPGELHAVAEVERYPLPQSERHVPLRRSPSVRSRSRSAPVEPKEVDETFLQELDTGATSWKGKGKAVESVAARSSSPVSSDIELTTWKKGHRRTSSPPCPLHTPVVRPSPICSSHSRQSSSSSSTSVASNSTSMTFYDDDEITPVTMPTPTRKPTKKVSFSKDLEIILEDSVELRRQTSLPFMSAVPRRVKQGLRRVPSSSSIDGSPRPSILRTPSLSSLKEGEVSPPASRGSGSRTPSLTSLREDESSTSSPRSSPRLLKKSTSLSALKGLGIEIHMVPRTSPSRKPSLQSLKEDESLPSSALPASIYGPAIPLQPLPAHKRGAPRLPPLIIHQQPRNPSPPRGPLPPSPESSIPKPVLDRAIEGVMSDITKELFTETETVEVSPPKRKAPTLSMEQRAVRHWSMQGMGKWVRRSTAFGNGNVVRGVGVI